MSINVAEKLTNYYADKCRPAYDPIATNGMQRGRRALARINYLYGDKTLTEKCDFCSSPATTLSKDRYGDLRVFVCNQHNNEKR